MATIKDVAREAGVSISTVSKIINKSSPISAATTEKVEAVMKKLHYYPNIRARNFARQTTKNIIYMMKIEKNVAFTNPHSFEIMCGIQEALAKKDYNLSIISSNSEEDISRLIDKIVYQKSADGIIIHASAFDPTIESVITKSNFPHMLIGKPDYNSALCWVDINNYLSGEITAKHVIGLGYKKIAFIGGAEDDHISGHRLEGARTIINRSHGTLLHNEYTDSSKEMSFEVMHKILREKKTPDTVICANNNIALGVVDAIKYNDFKIPDDISVITFDDYPYSRITEPMLSVVNIDVFDMGYQAAKTLLRKIKNPNLQVQSYSTLPTLIERGSTVKSK
ncbi:ribose operon transcriptional repressor RbsR [Vallitalea sediminicola]